MTAAPPHHTVPPQHRPPSPPSRKRPSLRVLSLRVLPLRVPFLRALCRNQRGSVAIEGLFGGLLLLSWLMIAYEFYDAFRTKARVTAATYTVADLISRQKSAIGPNFIHGTKAIFDQILRNSAANASWLRISLVACPATATDQDACDGHSKYVRLDHSYATGGHAVLSQSMLDASAARIPVMAAGDTVVITETIFPYRPLFGIGDRALTLDGTTPVATGLTSNLTFREFITTRPRGPRIIWQDDA